MSAEKTGVHRSGAARRGEEPGLPALEPERDDVVHTLLPLLPEMDLVDGDVALSVHELVDR